MESGVDWRVVTRVWSELEGCEWSWIGLEGCESLEWIGGL